MRRGHFIVFEGLDGSGKSTHARILSESLNALGEKTLLTCEPTTEDIGRLIRSILGGRSAVSRETLVQLFAADRLDHVKRTILPALEEGINVITDRYVYSSCAYQSELAPVGDILAANRSALELLPAEGVIYLELAPEKCLERINSTRTSTEIYEELGSLKRTEAAYRESFALCGAAVRFVSADRATELTAEAVLRAYRELTE